MYTQAEPAHSLMISTMIQCVVLMQMVSLYRDPKGERVLPRSLATTSDVKRSMKPRKPTTDRSDMESTINMYKNRIVELEDEVGRVRTCMASNL